MQIAMYCSEPVGKTELETSLASDHVQPDEGIRTVFNNIFLVYRAV